MNKHYSEEFKRNVVKQILVPGAPSLNTISRKTGVASSTIFGWKKKYANSGTMSTKTKKNRGWGPQEKLQAIIETSSLKGPELGEYLRKNGVLPIN